MLSSLRAGFDHRSDPLKVEGVPLAEQRIQGGVVSQFYEQSGIGQGDPFQVVVRWLSGE